MDKDKQVLITPKEFEQGMRKSLNNSMRGMYAQTPVSRFYPVEDLKGIKMPDENNPQVNLEAEEEKIPNAATRAAMEEARNMTCARFANAEQMFAHLENAAKANNNSDGDFVEVPDEFKAIQIIVNGFPGTGKSTLAVYIARQLKSVGVKVELVDNNSIDVEGVPINEVADALLERLEDFKKKNRPVIIRTSTQHIPCADDKVEDEMMGR